MRIASYNVNGIRAALSKGLIDWMRASDCDLICLQEIKAQEDQIPLLDFAAAGYEVYSYPAQKKGYSGVAILCKMKPDKIIYGMDLAEYDAEGRFIRVEIGDLSVISVYHPSGTSGDLRQEFKMRWLNDFSLYIEELKKTNPKLILCGDFNICHQAIDIHDPVRNAKSSGFLPEERAWFGEFLASGFVDSFRYLNPGPNHYTWWSYRSNARIQNKGWRIDYILASQNLKENIKRSIILPDAYQSDHCPIITEFEF